MARKQKQQDKDTKLTFEIGKIYKLTRAAAVRKGPGFHCQTKLNAIQMTDGKRHKLNFNGELDEGTPILCKEVAEVVGNTWIRCPSGWILAAANNEQYLT